MKNLVKFAAILTIIIGCIHIAATPMVKQEITNLSEDNLNTFLYMFVATGAAVIFVGIVLFLSVKNLHSFRGNLKYISLLSVVFLLILSLGAILPMPTNPFAYIMCGISLLAIVPVGVLFVKFRQE